MFYCCVSEHTESRLKISFLCLLLNSLYFSVCQVGFALLHSGASRKGSAVTPFVVNALNLGELASTGLTYKTSILERTNKTLLLAVCF